MDIVPVMALHPIRAPKLNVRPRKSCGHHVRRFISGYVAMSGNVIIPNIMVMKLNCKRMVNPVSNKVAKNSRPCLGLMMPLARGRFFVLSTSLSKSRSHTSLITHPAPRMIIAPIMKRVMV